VRLLFVSHTRSYSGAEVAMMRLVTALMGSHEVGVASPRESRIADEARTRGVAYYALPAVDLSLRMDAVETTTGLAQLARGGLRVHRAARHFGAQIVHANTLRAGLMCAFVLPGTRRPVVVQSHEHLKRDPVSRGVRQVLSRTAAAVVAVCEHTAQDFNVGLRRTVARRVYISIDHARFSPERVQAAPIRQELGLPADAPLLGQVAQITPWKGQDDAIRVLAALRRRGVPAHLLLVGNISFSGRGVRYDNDAFKGSLHALVDDLGVRGHVHWLGWREDVPAVVRAFDLSLLPSRHEPFGTAAAESMAMGTPALVSCDGGPSEYVIDGESGCVLPPGRPELWAQAAFELLCDPASLAQMSERARRAVARFNDDAYSREMMEIYRSVLGRGSPTPDHAPAERR
jgi:L-malate glycosyltransferase